MIDDLEGAFRALRSRDPRFDGWFVVAITTTGIYCRPSCPSRPAKREHVRFHATAAAAQHAGFRACKRCRPDATPGSPAWDLRADLTARAMRLIADGVVDREGVAGLARRLGYSERHLTRQLTAEVGVGPLALARDQRSRTARVLIETTALPFTEVAFAAGFASVRQFNDTVRAVFATTPSDLRRRAARRGRASAVPTEGLALRLPFRRPGDVAGTLDHLAARAVPGVESVTDDGRYVRSLSLPHGAGVAELRAADGYVACTLHLTDLRDLTAAVQRCRRLLDLDADPVAVAEVLGADAVLGADLARRPGRRVVGTVDGAELAVRAVLGQQVSVAAARTLAGRLAAELGAPLDVPVGAVTLRFPHPGALAEAPEAALPLPASRRRTLRELAAHLADGRLSLDPGADRDGAEAALLALPGIGPWTAGYVRMRALGDPDVFLPTDLGVRRALAARGLPDDPRAAATTAGAWRPWRSYALAHLWAGDATAGGYRSTAVPADEPREDVA
ncbi:DNA-3-methyladenine glycosylase 2 family protein [Nitriliruptoraceae bacterium ZYF776]|nr:DNA-3-methyladenine glycosylase 2 family protein [Profundirhabdus halotolerans]